MKILLNCAAVFLTFAAFTGVNAQAGVTDTKTKDCKVHVIAGTNGKGQEVSSESIKGNVTKDMCFSSALKDPACDKAKSACGKNPSIAGSYVAWGTSRENCSHKCPGHDNDSPKDLVPY